MISKITFRIADLFCGAGGFDEGARRALLGGGHSMQLVAVNHWQTAISSHELNHPEATRFCVDIYKTSPREAVPSGELDLLMASPTCVFYTRARGAAPISWDQREGRMSPTQVLRWCTDLEVRCLLVENVPEFLEWGPVCKATRYCKRHDRRLKKGELCGKPRREKKGSYFRAWVRRLERLGYKVAHRVLCAANFGDATTRKRLFLIARKDVESSEDIVWPIETHSKGGAGGLLPWRAAAEIIEWDLLGESIYDRKNPHSPLTLVRLHAGAVRFAWPAQCAEELREFTLEVFGKAIKKAKAKRTNKGRARVARLTEALCDFVKESGEVLGNASPSMRALVMRTGMHKSNALCVRDTADPLATVTTDGGLGIVRPVARTSGDLATGRGDETQGYLFPDAFMAVLRRNADARDLKLPLPTITAGGQHLGLSSFVLNRHGENGATRAHSVNDPTPTATTRGAGYLVKPFMLSQASGGAPRSTEDPVPTIPTDGAHAFVTAYYGNGKNRSTKDPLATITTKDRFGLAFIPAAFGERKGQRARVRSVNDPVTTICAKGRIPLARAVQTKRRRFDILLRMFTTRELARAMSFDDYKFVGTKEDVTRQIGNAVPVRTAAALVAAILGVNVPTVAAA